MNNKIIIAIIAVATVFLCWVAYEHFVAIPRAELAAEQAQERQERIDRMAAEREREANYKQCVRLAYLNYTADWDGQCELLGKEDNCSLPRYIANEFDDDLDREKDNCIKMYK